MIVGSPVHAGSVVLRGRLVVRASAVGNETTIGRIITRVEEAQHDRAPIQTVGRTSRAASCPSRSSSRRSPWRSPGMSGAR